MRTPERQLEINLSTQQELLKPKYPKPVPRASMTTSRSSTMTVREYAALPPSRNASGYYCTHGHSFGGQLLQISGHSLVSLEMVNYPVSINQVFHSLTSDLVAMRRSLYMFLFSSSQWIRSFIPLLFFSRPLKNFLTSCAEFPKY